MKIMRSAVVLLSAIAAACGAVPDTGADRQETVASEGQAITATWSGQLSTFGITTNPCQIATASRGDLLLDMFTTYNGSVIFYRYNQSWNPYVTLPTVSGVSFQSVAVANNSNRLEVIATGQSGSTSKLYYTHSTTSGTGALSFADWTTVSGATPYAGCDDLALVTWGGGRLDAFWILPTTGNIGHAWGTNGLSDGTETGNTSSLTYLQPLYPSYLSSLNVVSWGTGRLDLIIPGGTGLQHHWYDSSAGGWGTVTNPHRETKGVAHDGGSFFTGNPNNFALLSSGVGQFEAYATDTDTYGSGNSFLYHTTYSSAWGWTLSGPQVSFDQILTPNGLGPQGSNILPLDAIYWQVGGLPRRDIFGGSAGWQAYY